MIRAIGIVLVAALASACGGLAATDTPPSESPARPSPSLTLATQSSAPSQTPEGSEGPVTLSFERVANVHGAAELYAIEAFEGGFAAGGCRLRAPLSDGSEGGCASAYALLSADGSSWTELPLPGAADVKIVGLSATPLGLLAFGSTYHSESPQARAIWRLVGGDRWEPLPVPAPSSIVFRMAAPLSGRTVFIGSDTAYDLPLETEAWSTVDGTSWSTGSMPWIPKVAAEPGLVAVGYECEGCEPGSLTHVYRSADGIAWTAEEPPPDLASTRVGALAAWNHRVILGGQHVVGGSAVAAVWLDEPTGWRRVVLPEGTGYALSSIVVSDQGVMAIGRSATDHPAATWWSTDGITWNPARLEGIAMGYIAASVAGNPLVVIVNYDSIWIANF